jgi:glycosyltransferase involved in cell wall biosynthesis
MGFPTVLTLHDYGYACPISTFYIYPTGRICTLRGLSKECRRCQCIAPGADKLKALHVARLAGQRYLYRVPQRLRHFIAVSEFSLDVLRSYLPPEAEATVLPNPVEVEDHGPSDVAEHREMLFVGRLTREKDPVTVARAAHGAGLPVRFAGDGPMVADVREANPEAETLGWVKPEDVRALYRQARAFVMASTWYETAGLVVLEALSQGLPVIVSDKCASREYVEDGVNGLWFEGGSVSELQTKMRLLDDPELATRMGRAAYDRFWADPPTMEAHLRRLTELYERMLRERP